MRLLFESKDRPLYGSAVPMRLGRLRDADIAAYVAARFEATGPDRRARRSTRSLARRRGIPQRAMLLAHRLWEEVAQGAEATLDDWDARPRSRDARARRPSSTPSGGASTPPSRRRCARCSWETARRTGRLRSGGSSCTEGRRRGARFRASPRRRRSRSATRVATRSSIRSSPSWIGRLERRPVDRELTTIRPSRACSPTCPTNRAMRPGTSAWRIEIGRYGNHGTVTSRLPFSTRRRPPRRPAAAGSRTGP